MPTYKFPEGFLWGTATSAHQVEGNNTNSDWWMWEHEKIPRAKTSNADFEYPLDQSLQACDSYNRYKEDFDLCVMMNNNAVRFSVEWARLEPKEGQYDEKEFDHYKRVISAARERNLKVFLTLHHFTNPIWFAKKGAWEKGFAVKKFADFAQKCAEEFGETVDAYITINEPQVLALQAYTKGEWYPCKANFLTALKVQLNLMKAHNSASKAIKKVNKKYQVGIVKNIVWYDTTSHIFDKIASKFLEFMGSDFFLIPVKKHCDFIGLNFYFTTYIRNFKTNNPDDRNSDLRWWICPSGLEKVLLRLKKYKLPIYITENGVADARDNLRSDFIRDMLVSCGNAINKGVDLRGYFHWSLIDNFEWHHGYWPRFGLVEIDRENGLARKPRPSAFYYGEICKHNMVKF